VTEGPCVALTLAVVADRPYEIVVVVRVVELELEDTMQTMVIAAVVAWKILAADVIVMMVLVVGVMAVGIFGIGNIQCDK